MGETFLITELRGRQILDSRGNPTVEAEVIVNKSDAEGKFTTENPVMGRAAVPSGASTGRFEAVELRDKEKAYLGQGVTRAVSHINHQLQQDLLGKEVLRQLEIDRLLCEIDGTENKGALGANAILGVSLAVAKAAAATKKQPLYRYLRESLGQAGSHAFQCDSSHGCGKFAKQIADNWEKMKAEYQGKYVMPLPMMNILNGGKHARNTVDFQEFMIMPVGAESFRDALRMGTEIYHTLKKILSADGKSTAVGDEGGFAPDLKDAFEVFDYLTKAVEEAGYVCGKTLYLPWMRLPVNYMKKTPECIFSPEKVKFCRKKKKKSIILK